MGKVVILLLVLSGIGMAVAGVMGWAPDANTAVATACIFLVSAGLVGFFRGIQ